MQSQRRGSGQGSVTAKPRTEHADGGRGWWQVTLAFFAVAQVMDVLSTMYALDRGRIEGSPISSALMPDGQLLPWIAAKLLVIVLVGALAALLLARRFGRRASITVSLVIAAGGVLTLVTAVQNVLLAGG